MCSVVTNSLQPQRPGVRQTPLSVGFLQARILECLPSPPPGDLPDPGVIPHSPTPRLLCLLHWQADSFPLASIFYTFRQNYKLSPSLWSWAPTRAFLPSVTHANRTRPSLVQDKGKCPPRIRGWGGSSLGSRAGTFPPGCGHGGFTGTCRRGGAGAPEAQAHTQAHTRRRTRRRTSTARAPDSPRQPS